MRFKIRTLFLFLLLATAPMLFAADCGTAEFCGKAIRLYAGTMTYPANEFTANTQIDYYLDPHGMSWSGHSFATSCNFTGGSCDTWNSGSSVNTCGNNPVTYYLAVRRTPDGWGQDGVPLATVTSYGLGCQSYATVYVPPAPLVPTVTHPTRGEIVYANPFDIRFQSGIDAPRANPGWPVTYKVRLKTWPSGTSEPATWPAPFYTGPCVQTADGSGDCKVAVSNLGSGNYRVMVEAAMDVSASIQETYLRPVIFTNSATQPFSVPTDARPVAAVEPMVAGRTMRPATRLSFSHPWTPPPTGSASTPASTSSAGAGSTRRP